MTKGREFDHVLVLGLQSSRMPGARRVALEPIPDALLHEELPADTRDAHVAEMRRLLHLGMTRAREGLVLAYVARTERGALQPPSPFAEDARAAVGGRLGGPRGGALRPRRGAARRLHRAARRAAARRAARRRDARRAAPGHRPRDHPRRRALPGAGEARGAHRTAPTRSRCADALAQVNARARARDDRPAARDPRDQPARRADPRRRARRARARGGDRAPRRAVARGVPAAPRRRARAQRLGHRHLPDVPAEVQVRARLPDPATSRR